MLPFRRLPITVSCAFRGGSLSAPPGERLVKACPEAQRRRLRRRLARAPALWTVSWDKSPGDELQPRDRVAVLLGKGVVVELRCARRGVLGERLVGEGEAVAPGTRLAAIRRPAPPDAAADGRARLHEAMLQFMARRRRDAERIRDLQRELEALRRAGGDAKFRRLKLEFSKRFHPDGGADERERRHRQLVFQEFWPVVEAIERS